MIGFDRDVVFLDCETLGLDRRAPIWEFAAIRVRFDDGPEYAPRLLQIRHHESDWLESLPESFAADYRARYDAESALPAADAVSEIRAITDGAIVAGSNPSFDMDRLELLMQEYGFEPGWHHHPLDIPSMVTGNLAACPFKGVVPLLWRSSSLSLHVQVDPDDFARHTAMGDVRWCLAQWRRMTEAADH